MRESAFALGIVVVLGLLAAVMTLPPETVMLNGQVVMLGAGAVGMPLEVVYFTALGLTLWRRSVLPPGWYWRSFEHHHLLVGAERWLVLPWFYVGAISFLICTIGICVTASGLVATIARL